MSVEAMAIVLHHSRQTGTKKLLLVGIANHDGDGGAWPTIETLSKYANTDERNVRRRLSEIVDDGELVIHYNAGGNLRTAGHERPNLYEILVTCPPNCDGSRNHRLLPLEVVQGGEGSTTSPPAPEVGGGRTTPGGEGRTTPPPPGSTTPPGGGRTTPQTVPEPSFNRPSSSSPTADAAGDQAAETPPKPDPNDRDDVRAVCALMVGLVVGNGCKRPEITKAWQDAARLMLDRDGRDLGEALDVMRWAAADPFWRTNILSVPKFREKYDQLRLKALETSRPAPAARADEDLAAGRRLAAQLRAAEAAAAAPTQLMIGMDA